MKSEKRKEERSRITQIIRIFTYFEWERKGVLIVLLKYNSLVVKQKVIFSFRYVFCNNLYWWIIFKKREKTTNDMAWADFRGHWDMPHLSISVAHLFGRQKIILLARNVRTGGWIIVTTYEKPSNPEILRIAVQTWRLTTENGEK